MKEKNEKKYDLDERHLKKEHKKEYLDERHQKQDKELEIDERKLKKEHKKIDIDERFVEKEAYTEEEMVAKASKSGIVKFLIIFGIIFSYFGVSIGLIFLIFMAGIIIFDRKIEKNDINKEKKIKKKVIGSFMIIISNLLMGVEWFAGLQCFCWVTYKYSPGIVFLCYSIFAVIPILLSYKTLLGSKKINVKKLNIITLIGWFLTVIIAFIPNFIIQLGATHGIQE